MVQDCGLFAIWSLILVKQTMNKNTANIVACQWKGVSSKKPLTPSKLRYVLIIVTIRFPFYLTLMSLDGGSMLLLLLWSRCPLLSMVNLCRLPWPSCCLSSLWSCIDRGLPAEKAEWETCCILLQKKCNFLPSIFVVSTGHLARVSCFPSAPLSVEYSALQKCILSFWGDSTLHLAKSTWP